MAGKRLEFDSRTEQLLRECANTQHPLDAIVLYRNADGWAFVYRLEDVDDALFELRTAAIRLRALVAARRRDAAKRTS